jgi:hypothetical protein
MNSLPQSFRPLMALSVVLGAATCVPADTGPEWGGSVVDSAGVRMVHNPATGLWGPGYEWVIIEGLTIGSDTMDTAYQFGRVTDLAVTDDGAIVVLDAMASEVRIFDQEGVHLRTFGQPGEGPGEFSRSAAAVFLMDEGHLAIPDMGNSRISSFGLDGAFLGSVTASYANGFPVRWGSSGAGEVVVQRRAMGFNEDPDLAAGDPLVRMDAAGEEELLVILPPAKTVRMEGAAARFTYFETEPSWHLGSGGTFRTGMTQVYRIELRGSDAAVHTIVTKETVSRPVTDSDRDRFAQLMREALTRRGTAPDAVGRFINRLEYGPTFPAFNQIMEGPGGSTLVQQVQEISAMESVDLQEEQSRRLGATLWDVFDDAGRYLGEISLPPRFTPLLWRDSAVYGRWLDDVDRHHVMRLEIQRGASGP